MGNHLASQSATLDYYLHDLPGIVYESSLGKGRFLKTLQCIHDEGTVVVKVYIKREASQSLKEHVEKLNEIREYFNFIENPNALPFRKWIETDRAGYLIRQYFVNNLYDRISTRPFLTPIEKKWIVFQLLTALTQVHFYGICHGDIKCENVMVTSWNWIYLSDFASYKPTYIPEDNPADFSFFFDSGGRRTCYLAPERFYTNVVPEGEITHEMDIFSVGCVIAELFLEGTPIFKFSDMVGYRKGTYDPHPAIDRINDPSIQELVKHMIQKDPKKRYSAQKYLTIWAGTAFPEYFKYLHGYIGKLMRLDADEKMNFTRMDFQSLLDKFLGKDVTIPSDLQISSTTKKEEEFSPSATPPLTSRRQPKVKIEGPQELDENDPNFMLLMSTEKYAQNLEEDQNNIGGSSYYGSSIANQSMPGNSFSSSSSSLEDNRSPITPPTMLTINKDTFIVQAGPLSESVKTSSDSLSSASTSSLSASIRQPQSLLTASNSINQSQSSSNGTEGLVIILDIVCSFIPIVKYPSTKLTALTLFHQFSKYLDSEIRLQRIVPYIVYLLSDESALVRATAIRTLASVLEQVDTFPPSDSHLFPAYILPALSKFSSEEPEELVREAYAENLALFAETAKKFLETTQFFKHNAELSASDKHQLSNQESYDAELTDIQEAFYELVFEMLTKDMSTAVRRTLLSDITRLCIFFGRQKTNDFLLPLIITFLNDRHDWELRCAFFQNIVGVSAFVGMDSLELFILPCILQALTDEEEFVIDKAVNSLAALCEQNLFRKHVLFDIAEKSAPMLYHPNMWIRYGVIALMSAISCKLKLADIHCFLIPTLRPYLLTDIIEITEENLLEALKPPLPRSTFDKAMAVVYDTLVAMEHSNDVIAKRLGTSGNPLEKSGFISDESQRNTFEGLFKQKISEIATGKDDDEKLWIMRKFIRSATQAKKSKFGKHEEDPLSIYSNITLPVHSVSVPTYAPPPIIEKVAQSLRGFKINKSQTSTPTSPIASSVDLRKTFSREDFRSQSFRDQPIKPVRKNSSDAQLFKMRPVYSNPDIAALKGLPPNFPSRLFPPPPSDIGQITSDAILSGESFRDWQPKGILVAHLHEHKAPVNHVQVSKDNMFFVSASDDGAVKIWDCMRLEKNVTNRSRSTYSSQGGKIKALTILENSHSIASGSDNGSIHIFKVEYTTKKESNLHRYTGLSTVKNIDMTEGSIVGLDHFNTESQSLLVYATNKGKIHCWDLRSKQESWVMNNPSNTGLLTTFVIEPNKNWLVTGTSSGYFTCWDMRFQIPVKTWRHFSRSRIYKLIHYGSHPTSSWIFATTGSTNEVTVWDVESGSCKQLFRVGPSHESDSLSRIDTSETSLPNYGIEELQNPSIPPRSSVGIKGLVNPPESTYLITAGDDKKIRYWDFTTPSNSYTICGLASEQTKPKFSSFTHNNTTVFQEQSASDESNDTSSAFKSIPNQPSVNHHESILDLKLLELPHRMLISAGRDGVVKVWK